jgi:hypothetical protein
MGPWSRHTPAARYFRAVAQDGRIAKIDIIKAFRQDPSWVRIRH